MSSYCFKCPVGDWIDGQERLNWAKRNCPSYITNDVILKVKDGKSYYRFYFSNERDYTLFALKWS